MQAEVVRSVTDLTGDSGIIVPWLENQSVDDAVRLELGQPVEDELGEALGREEFKGRLYETFMVHPRVSSTRHILFVGLGAESDINTLRFTRAISAGTFELTRHGFHDLAVLLRNSNGVDGAAVAQAVVQGSYDAGLLKTGPRPDYRVNSLSVVDGASSGSKAEIERGRIIGESINLARDLVNLPPNDINPTTLGECAQEVAGEAGLSCRILDEHEIAALGMGAIMGVARGTAQPPRVVELRYGEGGGSTQLAYVGKGLTFDSGGLSLKTHEGMEWMKGDMAGSAAVIGGMRAIGLLKPPGISVCGLIGAVENMPGANAMKPGDVLRTLSGKTIEVLNTDAEGRLVLADVLAHAVRLGATHIVDLATLTGAAVVALGREASAIIGNDQEWVDAVKASGARARERLWQLPLYPEYRKQIDSEIADMKNTGGRGGGAITAASLLAEFVDTVPWAHLDIAGTAWTDTKSEFAVKGATGVGVGTLVQLAFDVAAGAS